MPHNGDPAQIKAQICKAICIRYIEKQEGTRRKMLIIDFGQPEVITELIYQDRALEQWPNDDLVPRFAAFVISADPDLLDHVKTRITVLAESMKRLYMADATTASGHMYPWESLMVEARKISDGIEEASVRQVFPYLQELGLGAGYQQNDAKPGVAAFSISDFIVKIKNVGEWFDAQLEQFRPMPPRARGTSGEPPTFVPAPLGGLFEQAGLGEAFDWNLLHPEIRKVAKSRFDSCHYADAVEASLKEVNDRVRRIFRQARNEDRDGAGLMQEAFSPNSPVLVLGDDTRSGRDMQLGYMQIFAGTMTGIRNPKAHGNITISPERAIHFLFLASLLMFKIDEATIPTPATKEPADPTGGS